MAKEDETTRGLRKELQARISSDQGLAWMSHILNERQYKWTSPKYVGLFESDFGTRYHAWTVLISKKREVRPAGVTVSETGGVIIEEVIDSFSQQLLSHKRIR